MRNRNVVTHYFAFNGQSQAEPERGLTVPPSLRRIKAGPWYTIKAAASSSNEPVEILIYDFIGQDFWGEGVGAKQFVQDLAQYKSRPLNVRVNSPGGDVWDGLAIYNALVNHNAAVNVTVDGLAASMASVIAFSGDTLSMPENAMLMIHEPWVITAGKAKDLEATIQSLRRVRQSMLNIYERNSNLSQKNILAMMETDTWISAQEAQDYGMVTEVTPGQRMAACFDLSCYRNVPEPLRHQMLASRPRSNQFSEELARLRDEVANRRKAA